jgi:ubiquinone/menaquinone biosynthesis C-methylase UbiE
LDIASGTGYGTFELSHVAKQITGIDVDKQSINLANKQYQNTNLAYKV